MSVIYVTHKSSTIILKPDFAMPSYLKSYGKIVPKYSKQLYFFFYFNQLVSCQASESPIEKYTFLIPFFKNAIYLS